MYTKPLYTIKPKSYKGTPAEVLYEATKWYMTPEEKEKYKPRKDGEKNE